MSCVSNVWGSSLKRNYAASVGETLWTEPLSVTLHWKADVQYLTVVLFLFQFYPVCYFAKFIRFALSGVKGSYVCYSVARNYARGDCVPVPKEFPWELQFLFRTRVGFFHYNLIFFFF